jgi:hypothetical protein
MLTENKAPNGRGLALLKLFKERHSVSRCVSDG